ncbi:hypothetical protein SNE40_017282 [Patella caerulea]|uniref:Uncharacterized protein n=1 Tax=Patella caerulea TaxID=87958 RepID=A0AAN8PDT1_PATCE
MITAQSGGHKVTRNFSHFKRDNVNPEVTFQEEGEDDNNFQNMEDEYHHNNHQQNNQHQQEIDLPILKDVRKSTRRKKITYKI